MKNLLCAFLFLVYWLACSFSEDVQPAPAWYLVSSLELEKLETLSANSEASRQRAESSLRESQKTATALRENSTRLTEHLRKERETTQRLERSFNQFVVDQSNSQQAVLARATKAEMGLEKKKAETARILAVAIGEALAILAYLLFKFRSIIRKMIPV